MARRLDGKADTPHASALGSAPRAHVYLLLTLGTVCNYLSLAIQKLDAHNRVEAARIAEQKDWL